MNRSMKQMLSMLLVVAMMAAMLVIPSAAAGKTDKVGDVTYTLGNDVDVSVDVDKTYKVSLDASYVVAGDTTVYGVDKDTVYVTVADTAVVDAAYVVNADTKTVDFTLKGLKAGKTTVTVKLAGTDLQSVITVTVKEAAKPSPSVKPSPSTEPSTKPSPLPEGAKVFEADKVYAALDPDGSIAEADPNKDFKGAKEAYTMDGFTIYPKFKGYTTDGASKGNDPLEIRLITRWKNADKATPVWADGYAPERAFRMDGGGNKTAEFNSDGSAKEFVSNVIKFTVDGPADVTVWFIQKEAAAVAAYKEMNPTAVVKSDAITAAGGEAGIATLKLTEAGTYYVGGCDADGLGSKLNVAKIMVVPGKAEQPSEQPSPKPEMTVYTVKPDAAKVSVRVNGTKDVKVTTEPANGKVYVVSADAKIVSYSVKDNTVTLKGVKAGKTDVVLGVKDGKGTATVAVTVTSGGIGGGGGSSSTVKPAGDYTAKKTTDRNGNVTITVTDKNGDVVAKVEIPSKIPTLETKFVDVPDDHWAAKSINDLAALGLVKGVAENTYDMNSNVTRGSLATILFRLAQAKGATSDFTDVAKDAWYADAVGWAAKVGIIAGKGDNTFGADESITREQLALMLYRFAKLLGADTRATGDVEKFADGANTSDWAKEAMTWAVGAGILVGNTANELNPTAAASRAETACMVDRFISLLK